MLSSCTKKKSTRLPAGSDSVLVTPAAEFCSKTSRIDASCNAVLVEIGWKQAGLTGSLLMWLTSPVPVLFPTRLSRFLFVQGSVINFNGFRNPRDYKSKQHRTYEDHGHPACVTMSNIYKHKR